MCGRYFLNIGLEQLINRYEIDDIPDEIYDFKGEIFPSNTVPVVLNIRGIKKLRFMRWGFDSSYTNNLIINARSETVHKKKLFKESFHRRRCIVPANGFFEWGKTETGKQKYFIDLKDEEVISLAGIYDSDYEQNKNCSFCIITKDAFDQLVQIHDRAPVILKQNRENEWLKEVFTPKLFDFFNEKKLQFDIKKS
ncbi:MAG: SOS response-associated peptidase [Halanaerobiales bacterium]|nr:SOS response-associated peptidase [Halanaerobiales bacterium]